ncbi:hypothetical protein ASE23_21610 [Rhizobium sp. Root73]|nr:hypothetical protein ASD36_27675 [Rhizobium sp. Root1334]KRC12558.1 hypothetical protein ASE23_21610 [Rhizobium sp. Root73]
MGSGQAQFKILRPLSTKDSYGRFDGDAAIRASAHLTAGSSAEHLHQLQRRRHPRPKDFHALLAASAFSHSLAGNDALGPAEAYFMEMQIGKFRADMMKNTCDGSASPS